MTCPRIDCTVHYLTPLLIVMQALKTQGYVHAIAPKLFARFDSVDRFDHLRLPSIMQVTSLIGPRTNL